eukprot:Awhi_evm1s5182
MIVGNLNTGAVRYVYATLLAIVVGYCFQAGFYFWFSVVEDTGIGIKGPECALLATDAAVTSIIRATFYIFLFISSVINNQIPLVLTVPFLCVQGTTYGVFYTLNISTRL